MSTLQTQEMDLPVSIKEKLLRYAKKLPEDRRAQFIANTSKDVTAVAWEFAKDHKHTIIYSVIGAVVGHVLDQVLVIWIPFYGQWRPTQGMAALILWATGAGAGFWRDWEERHGEIRIRNILSQEIHRALKP